MLSTRRIAFVIVYHVEYWCLIALFAGFVRKKTLYRFLLSVQLIAGWPRTIVIVTLHKNVFS